MTYTKEQIEVVLREFKFPITDNAYTTLSAESIKTIISKPTKPASVFKVGEVVCFKQECEGYDLYEKWGDVNEYNSVRHLTPEEVPALALAIERLEIITDNQMDVACFLQDIAKKALDDIKELL